MIQDGFSKTNFLRKWGLYPCWKRSCCVTLLVVVFLFMRASWTNSRVFLALFFFFKFYVKEYFGWLYVCLCITCVPGVQEGQKKASDPLEVEYRLLWTTMWELKSQTWGLWISRSALKCLPISPVLYQLYPKNSWKKVIQTLLSCSVFCFDYNCSLLCSVPMPLKDKFLFS